MSSHIGYVHTTGARVNFVLLTDLLHNVGLYSHMNLGEFSHFLNYELMEEFKERIFLMSCLCYAFNIAAVSTLANVYFLLIKCIPVM